MIDYPYKIVLASNSPRRRELLASLDIPYQTRVIPGIAEDYPDDCPPAEVAQYVAREKAAAYRPTVQDDELVLTADTVVIVDGLVLGKPDDEEQARQMLQRLSGKTHQVVTGVCLLGQRVETSFSVATKVTFKRLSQEEIDYYVETYKPLDKAGAYGIQEWIGYVGVTHLEGSYFNVMGLPVQRIWDVLQDIRKAPAVH